MTFFGVVGIPVAAVAVGTWLTHTGEFGHPNASTDVIDRSEWLGLDASDAPAAIVALYNDSLPLPEGATRADVITPVSEMLAQMGAVPEGESGSVLIQETTVTGLFERAARCLWYREWLEADALNSGDLRDAATAGILGSTSWPITVASDGGGVVKMIQGAADAARAGDRSTVLAAYGECSNFYGEVAE